MWGWTVQRVVLQTLWKCFGSAHARGRRAPGGAGRALLSGRSLTTALKKVLPWIHSTSTHPRMKKWTAKETGLDSSGIAWGITEREQNKLLWYFNSHDIFISPTIKNNLPFLLLLLSVILSYFENHTTVSTIILILFKCTLAYLSAN